MPMPIFKMTQDFRLEDLRTPLHAWRKMRGRWKSEIIFPCWTTSEDKCRETTLKPWWDRGDGRGLKRWQWVIEEIKMIQQIKDPAGGESGGVEERAEQGRETLHKTLPLSYSSFWRLCELQKRVSAHLFKRTHTHTHTYGKIIFSE